MANGVTRIERLPRGVGEVRTDGVIGDRTRSLLVMHSSQFAAAPEESRKGKCCYMNCNKLS
jgi:hypothetical protein